ncbi:fused DSP-PTPase phosphatase/NAD kinase-like protein [Inhella crocodyli]|uniref:DSP-PTPase phosphatase fused to NAD+ Kinase domain-containing protein n=1 Tax=Inhella crocodyli TaxID=2499851 RepID=A0A437LS86_9BURK|nr:sulfur transferase domain-containing protein [Inhella crocodyli]RVT88252.1 hypothetical protein EOD73_04435 [Inhella crocodyli]
MRRRSTLWVGVGAMLGLDPARAVGLDAPNVVEIGPRLVTAGQPTRQTLAGLGGLGFQAVIYLAPSTVPDAVPEEEALLRRQGIEFVHLPVPFAAPTAAHAAAVSAALRRLQDQKVLVHCQVNMRASTMVFLHRVRALQADPAEAYEAVARVWSPSGPWRALVLEELKQQGIDFVPL